MSYTNFDILIEKSDKLTELLKELQSSVKSETYQYVVKFEFDNIYSLYDNTNSRLIKLDKIERINNWLKIRNISEDKIYKHE